MGWQRVDIVTDSNGTGGFDLKINGDACMVGIAIPNGQAGWVSGTGRLVVSDLMPDGVTAFPFLALTNPIMPYREAMQFNPVNNTGVSQSSQFVYKFIQSLNFYLTGAVANKTVTIWAYILGGKGQ